MSARKVQLGDRDLLAAREINRYAKVAARALEHVRDISKDCKMTRTEEASRRTLGEALRLERLAARQLEEIDTGDPDLLTGT